MAMRKEHVQDEGHSLGVRGIPAKAQQRWRALSPPFNRWDSHAREAFAVSCPNIKTLRRCRNLNLRRSSKRGRKKKPSLSEINPRDDCGVESRQAQREMDDPHGLNLDTCRAHSRDDGGRSSGQCCSGVSQCGERKIKAQILQTRFRPSTSERLFVAGAGFPILSAPTRLAARSANGRGTAGSRSCRNRRKELANQRVLR